MMQKPDPELEAEFNKDGIFFDERVLDLEPDARYVVTDIEIAVLDNIKASLPDYTIKVVTKRGFETIFGGWQIIDRDGQKLLTLNAYQRVPEEMQDLTVVGGKGQSFLDLCYYTGNEATPVDYRPDVFTKPRPDVRLGDLGWYLPSRIVDQFIDALGKINDTILAGLAEDAMIYSNEIHKV